MNKSEWEHERMVELSEALAALNVANELLAEKAAAAAEAKADVNEKKRTIAEIQEEICKGYSSRPLIDKAGTIHTSDVTAQAVDQNLDQLLHASANGSPKNPAQRPRKVAAQ